MKDYPEVQDEPLCKIVNGLKSFIFVAKNSNSNFVVGLDTCRILLNYKILFYSSSLSITMSSLNTFKWQNIVTFFFLSQSKGEYLVFLQLLQNFFHYHLLHYFYQFQQCQCFFHIRQIRGGYIVAYVFALLENLEMFRYHWMTNFRFRSDWPIQ